MSRSALKSSLVTHLQASLTSAGFRFIRSEDMFLREFEELQHQFRLIVLDHPSGLRISPDIGVRHREIERIFHQISGVPTKYQKYYPTAGTSAGSLIGDVHHFDCLFTDVQQTADVQGVILEAFDSVAMPFFKQYSSLAAIDMAVNARPEEPCLIRPMTWLRCATGTIVASLVKRPNLNELVETYSRRLETSDHGFYFKRYQSLRKLLESQTPAS